MTRPTTLPTVSRSHRRVPRPWSLALLIATACGSSRTTEERPKAALASSSPAQAEFRTLSNRWHAERAEQRIRLEVELRSFLQRHPEDDQTRLARAYLAWILFQKGELVEARRLIEKTKRGPLGTARDFSEVVEAALLTEHQRPLEAIRILRPLQGKIIDPVERFLTTEQLVVAALAAHLYSEALTYMVDWVEHANVRDRAAVKDAISSHLRRIPQRHLEKALLTLEPRTDDPDRQRNPQRFEHKQWLFEAISGRLAALAVNDKDATLAAKVLEKNPGMAVDPKSTELVRLATGGEAPATIAGRTIGLLLSTTATASRRRSSEVATGITSALGFVGESAGSLQLVFEEDTGDPIQSLNELSARGTALLVAGVTEASAEFAARYAEHNNAPVLLLSPSVTTGRYVFSMGISPEQELRELKQALAGVANERAIVGEDAADCESSSGFGFEFPFSEWRQANVDGVIIAAGQHCLQELGEQLRHKDFHPWFALGLEASAVRNRLGNEKVLILSTGHYPFDGDHARFASEFEQDFGRLPTWFETLGRDVAQIAIRVLSSLPEVRSEVATEVKTYHRQVREELERFRSPELWSSIPGEFGEDRQLRRTLKVRRPVATREP